MLSFRRTKKAIELTKYLCRIENHQIRWRQQVSKWGKVLGTGGFLCQKSEGNWSETLKKRIIARYKQEDWRVIKKK